MHEGDTRIHAPTIQPPRLVPGARVDQTETLYSSGNDSLNSRLISPQSYGPSQHSGARRDLLEALTASPTEISRHDTMKTIVPTFDTKTAPEHDQTPPTSGEGWQRCLQTMTEHDNHLIDGWKEELSNMLIFAGLFSAVVTAFAVGSFTTLQENPIDRSVEILTHISEQLSSISTQAPVEINASSILPASTFQPPLNAVWINVFWFLSLTLSLMAALFAILVQQWIRRYAIYPLVGTRDRIRMRQQRFDALHQWSVPQIISGLSILLQGALVLFMAGILIMLWSINSAVAASITAFAGILMAAFLITTGLPAFFEECPYQSPLSLGFSSVLNYVVSSTVAVACVLDPSANTTRARAKRAGRVIFPEQIQAIDERALSWTFQLLSPQDAEAVTPCLLDVYNPVCALVYWLAHTTGETAQSVVVAIQRLSPREAFWWRRSPVDTPPPWRQGDSNIAVLLPIALEYTLKTGGPRSELSTGNVLQLSRALFQDSPEYPRLVQRAMGALRNDAAPETVRDISWHAYWFSQNPLPSSESNVGGIARVIEWSLHTFSQLATPNAPSPTQTVIAQSCDLSFLAALHALALDYTSTGLRRISLASQTELFAALTAYLTRFAPPATHTSLWAWFAAFERLLGASESLSADDARAFPLNDLTRIIDVHFGDARAGWDELDWQHVFSLHERLKEYPRLWGYLVKKGTKRGKTARGTMAGTRDESCTSKAPVEVVTEGGDSIR